MDIYTYITIGIMAVIVAINLCNLLLDKKITKLLGVVNVILHLGVIVVLVLGKKSLDALFLVMLISLCSSLVFGQLLKSRRETGK